MTLSRPLPLMLASALLVMAGFPANAADDFYKGKTIKLVVGSAPGAGYDAYGRLIARHLGKYLPGQPNVLVTYMPGADGIIAGNYMANLAERDGTVFGTSTATSLPSRCLVTPMPSSKPMNSIGSARPRAMPTTPTS